MNFEAIAIVGVFVLALGIVLGVPGLWWARRKARSLPAEAIGKASVTPFGYVFYFLQVSALIATMAFPGLTGGMRIASLVIVVVVSIILERVARTLGFQTVRRASDGRA
jgi:uncharacterized membrane protein YozB (DUF420 family)